jgi:hypothetical protein
VADAIDPRYRTLIYVAAYTGLSFESGHWRERRYERGRLRQDRALMFEDVLGMLKGRSGDVARATEMDPDGAKRVESR